MAPVQEQQVQLGYGKANLANVLATYASMKVTAPFNRVTAIQSGKRIGQQHTTPVGRHDLNGALINSTVAHPYGTVILITASWKRRGASVRDGALFIRLRFGAPTYSIQAKVPVSHESICGDSFTVFAGMGDIMNADELALLGILPNRAYLEKFMSLEELEECFTITQLAGESAPRPSISAVAGPNGTVVREVLPAPQRRLIIRRG